MLIRAAGLGAEAAYKLLTGSVVPRPIAWITTVSPGGLVNLAPFSAFTFLSNTPPMIGVSIGRKAGVLKDTARNIRASREFVVNVADESRIDAVHASAREYPADVGEAELLGLATVASAAVVPPRLEVARVALECRLARVLTFGAARTNFFVAEVEVFQIDDTLLTDGKIDTARLRPLARLGGPRYATLGSIVTLAPIPTTPK